MGTPTGSAGSGTTTATLRSWVGGAKGVLQKAHRRLKRALQLPQRNTMTKDDSFVESLTAPENTEQWPRRVSLAQSVSESQIHRLTESGRFDGTRSVRTSQQVMQEASQIAQLVTQLRHEEILSTSSMSDSPASAASATSSTMNPSYDVNKLKDLSDDLRKTIADQGGLPDDPTRLRPFLLFAESALSEEARGVPNIELDTIKEAHLDNMVCDIIDCGKRHSQEQSKLAYVALARDLQKAWRTRFKMDYFNLDHTRTLEMQYTGGLRNVSFSWPSSGRHEPSADQQKAMKYTGRYIPMPWTATDKGAISENEWEYPPGYWWLNLACVRRDGAVGFELEKPTVRAYDIPVLPLLTGTETREEGKYSTIYIHEGLSDMHTRLLSHTGKTVRLLRGYRLRGDYAPQAGIRYDGVWTLTKYRHKLDTTSNVYTLEMHLEPAQDWRMTDELMQIPKPSQLDDWRLYQKLEAERIKHEKGEAAAIDWGIWNSTDNLEREEAKRVRTFKASVKASVAQAEKLVHGVKGEGPHRSEGRKSGDLVKRNSSDLVKRASRPKTMDGRKKSSEMRKVEGGGGKKSEMAGKKPVTVEKKQETTVKKAAVTKAGDGTENKKNALQPPAIPLRSRSKGPGEYIKKSEILGKNDGVRKSVSLGRGEVVKKAERTKV